MNERFCLILVSELSEGGHFPGEKLFWKLANSCGLSRASCFVRSTNDRTYENGSSFGASIALCLGGIAFRAATGIKGNIENLRGYCFEPSDCRPIEQRTKGIVGHYKTDRYAPGAESGDRRLVHKKGDPRYGWITSTQVPEFPPSLKWIIPTLDPVSIQEAGFRTIPALKADIARAVRALANEDFAPLSVRYLPFAVGMAAKTVAVDIETDGSGGITRIGISDGRTTFTAPWDANTRRIAKQILADETGLKIGHNLAFDIPKLEREGTEVKGPIFDTMLGAHLLQPDLYKGLQRVAPLYLDIRHWKEVVGTEPERYNATDVFTTWKIYEREKTYLEITGMYGLFTETIMPATRVLMDMTSRGIRVDQTQLGRWQEELGQKQRILMEEWNRGAPNVNPLSPAQLKVWLYKTKGFPTQKSYKGEVTTDETALRHIHTKLATGDAKAAIGTLLSLKRVSKLRGTYSEVELGEDGCVHPGYLPANKDEDRGAAATGRLASSNPNIQNQPLEARKLYIPHTTGNVFVEADYSQIELRIAAALSNDLLLLEALKGDVHARTMDLLGCDRVRSKNVLYGSIYGIGPRKLAKLLQTRGIETNERECRNLQDTLARTYTRLWAWRNEVVAEGVARHFLTNAFGRRRYFYSGSNDAPAMIDYLPQSNAADILWSILVPLDEFCRSNSGQLITTVHDSVLMEFPSAAPETVAGIREIMERPFDQIAPGFRCPIELKVGTNWGEMHDIRG